MPAKAKSSSPRKLDRVASDEESDVSGEIVRLDYALHGVVDGYHLDDGTFLHIEAHGTKEYDFHVGETVKATGLMRVLPAIVVLEVRIIERVELLGKRHGID